MKTHQNAFQKLIRDMKAALQRNQKLMITACVVAGALIFATSIMLILLGFPPNLLLTLLLAYPAYEIARPTVKRVVDHFTSQ